MHAEVRFDTGDMGTIEKGGDMRTYWWPIVAMFSVLLLAACDNGSPGTSGGDLPQQFVFREGLNGYSGTCNTKMMDTEPDHEYGGGVYMNVGYWGTPLDTERSLLRFDLSSIPQDAEIAGATLRLVLNNHMAMTSDYVIHLEIHEPDRPWVETEATWNNATASVVWDTGGGDYSGPVGSVDIPLNEYSAGDAVEISLDAALVQQWVSNPTENRGMLFRNTSEDTADPDTENSRVVFYTKARATEADRPRLVVEAHVE